MASARRASWSRSSLPPRSASASWTSAAASAAAGPEAASTSAWVSRRRPRPGSSPASSSSPRRSIASRARAGSARALSRQARSTSRRSWRRLPSETRPPNQAAALSSSLWASSKTTASCSGRIPAPSPVSGPHRQVGEVERVIDDHELGLLRPRPGLLGEAAGQEGTAPAGAAVGADGHLGPERRPRLEGELRAVPGLRRLDPALQALVVGGVLGRAEERQCQSLQALPAQVVLAALEHGDVELARERRRGRRHVLGQQLLLERLRRRRDDDPLSGLERRDQVRQALADPGAGLREQVLATLEGVCDLLRERSLLGPRLVAGKGGGQPPAAAEERVHVGTPRVERPPVSIEHLFVLAWLRGTAAQSRHTRRLRPRAR